MAFNLRIAVSTLFLIDAFLSVLVPASTAAKPRYCSHMGVRGRFPKITLWSW